MEPKVNTIGLVRVIMKSDKYTRADIETALTTAYENENLVLDFRKEDDQYVYLYLKDKPIQND